MGAIKGIAGWLGRKAILYGALVLAILAAAFVVPFIQSEWTKPATYLERAGRLEGVKTELETAQGAARRRLSETAFAAQRKGVAELDLALGQAKLARADRADQRRSGLARARSLAEADTDALLADGRLELEIQALDGEIAALSTARDRLAQAQAADAGLLAAWQVQVQAQAACGAATEALAAFERRWEVIATLGFYEREQHDRLRAARQQRCAAAVAARQRLAAAQALKQQLAAATQTVEQARGWADSQIAGAGVALEQQIARERTNAEGSWRAKATLWAERIHLMEVLRQAAIALVLISASPFLIRLFCYWVLAPLAMRRAAIRLQTPGATGPLVLPAEPSSPSVGLRLGEGEELLIRQDFLQTSSEAGRKDTQWLLDWRHPITSIATGLTFLTRIRGAGELTTVSAVQDPFAEVTVVTLPQGGACVLQPRALAAVVQPTARPLRVTAHWRLFSLNAWLTLQLRYLVFHGPARLVVQGGRGVRVERAERGRVFGQEQLIGFSTDLAYSVARTETFWPYFLGREGLLKDRVQAGEGVLIVEEAPRAGRGRREPRRGIEGMIDAGMKVFGM